MTKPTLMWCVKTPRGRLMPGTINRLRWRSTLYGAFEAHMGADDFDSRPGTKDMLERGYTVVRIKVEEV